MKTDVYDIQDTQATSSARIATALTALLVVLGLFFISFTIDETEEETEEGILVNFGTMDVGSGDIQPEQISDEFAELEDKEIEQESVPEPEYVPEPTPAKETEQLTQKEETVKLKEEQQPEQQPREQQEEQPQQETAEQETVEEPNEEPKPTINERALYPGKRSTNSSGEGVTGDAGDQGSTEGVPEPGAYEGTSTGLGDSGIGYSLSGRKLIRPPAISDNSNAQGKVTVKIKVDRNGNVITASLGTPTTISSSALQNKAIKAAERAKFDKNARAMEEQWGTITFVFKVR